MNRNSSYFPTVIADYIGFPAFVVGSRRPLKLGKYVHRCIPRVWCLLIWTFSKIIDFLPAVLTITGPEPSLRYQNIAKWH